MENLILTEQPSLTIGPSGIVFQKIGVIGDVI